MMFVKVCARAGRAADRCVHVSQTRTGNAMYSIRGSEDRNFAEGTVWGEKLPDANLAAPIFCAIFVLFCVTDDLHPPLPLRPLCTSSKRIFFLLFKARFNSCSHSALNVVGRHSIGTASGLGLCIIVCNFGSVLLPDAIHCQIKIIPIL